MKKCLSLVLIILSMINGASQETTAPEIFRKNEISVNLLDMVVAGTIGLNYERIFNNNQSLFIGANLFDTYGYYDVGTIEDNSAFSLRAAYLVYFSNDKDHHGFFFYPQLKFRFGEITIDDNIFIDIAPEPNFSSEFTYDIGGVSAGFGLGHKWIFANKFTLMLDVNIARNLGNFDDDYLDNLELRLGVNFGYRF
ncbi:hypothetical protein [uncultured Winogradskyella sp.]|uniref:hypothetical protein n=1 Tax=uncultured Winogradskyella sp. TaxID=395353 RepID=UPI0035163832